MDSFLEENRERIPRHVAIIMDGNGRWAKQKGLLRTEGHKAGAERLTEVVNTCLDMGIQYLTVYAFSTENWKRPKPEVSGIMRLSELFFNRKFETLKRKGVYFVHLGERERLPLKIVRILDKIERNNTTDRKLVLNIAFNYSGRSEIIRAFRNMGELLDRGELSLSDITEERLGEHLYTGGMPDPDLLIRTGGEMRVSNFLLWQIAYTELWVTDVLWPDFSVDIFSRAIEEYIRRERRFGGL